MSIVIASAAFYLEETWMREPTPPKEVAHSEAPARQPLPARLEPQQGKYSTPTPVEKPRAIADTGHGPGKVAIIIDDMGSSMQELQSLLSIKLPVTFSVIPSLAHARGVAEAAHGAGAEVMVHMPMEPEGYPKQPMEKIGLLVGMDDAEISNRVTGYFRSVPFASGANNHMGSLFTQNADKMEAVLKVLKEKGVFFVDSRTSPASIAYEKAKILGVKCAARQVFLDNVQDEAAIGKQLDQVAAIARKKGSAIAIGHPHPSTIRALKAKMPQLAQSGITFLQVSALTR